MTRHTASPTQLKSGEWGARVTASRVKVGDELTVVTRSGSSWDAVVQAVIWQGPDVALCRTARAHPGRCTQCGRRAVDAPHHAAMGGLCGDCAFDEYDM